MTTNASAQSAAGLDVRKDATLTRLVLQRPELGNSLSNALVIALSAAVDACYADGTRMLVIEGSGANFCTGFDLSQLDSETDDSLLARFVRVELLLQKIYHAPFVTVALAHGRATGAGADLFAACEQRWIVDSAKFSFPGAAFGIVLGTSRLAKRVGSSVAREWVRTGASIDSEAARQAGLASRIVARSELDAASAIARAGAERLDAATLAAVHGASLENSPADSAADLYRLALSASQPGLRQRIVQFRAAAKR
jgi:enoyl-CoA hydratase